MGKPIRYNPAELAWIEANKTMPRRQAHDMFCGKFGRSDVALPNFTSLCKRNGWLTSRNGQYAPGTVPANKGRKMPYNENCARTQFKKGQMPVNAKPIGYEKLSRDGYVEIMVQETNPHTGADRRYVHKHRWLWEKLHGPVPPDHCLKCLDCNKQNTGPSNWEMLPRAMLPRLNGIYGRDYDKADPALKPTIMAVAKLEQHARTIKKQ